MFATLCCCHLFMLTCRSVTKHFPVLQPAHNYLTTVPKYIEKRVVLFVRSDFTLNFWKIKLPGSLNQDISTIYYWITIVQYSSILCGIIKKKLLISTKPYRLFGTTLFGIWNLSYPNSSSRRNWNTKQKHLQSPIFKRRLPNRHDKLGRQHCVQNSSQNLSRHMATSHAASSLTKSDRKKKRSILVCSGVNV